MSIQTIIKQTYAIHITGMDESLDSILAYISENIDLWKDKNTLWDISALDFTIIDAGAIRLFTQKIQHITKVRAGLKTAIVVNSDLAFGMSRMFQLLYNDKINIITQIFRNREDALQWLTENG